MQYTDEQICILEEEGSMRVLAAAGSGKTTTMAGKVKKEVESGRSKPEEICFITFTRFAADQICSRVKRAFGYPVDILYGTFNSMMGKILMKASIYTAIKEGLYDARMEEWVNNFMNLLRIKDPRIAKIVGAYKLLIVDEFQDLDPIQFELITLFKAINPTLRVIAIGDLAQNIYRFRNTSNEFLRRLLQSEVCPDLKTYTLTTNFRSTKAILKAVNAVFEDEIKAGHVLPMIAPLKADEGMKPQYYEFAINPGKGMGEYEELVAKTIFPTLLRAKQESKSVALIFPITKCSSFELINGALAKYIKDGGYQIDLHKIAKEDETCQTVTFRYDPKENTSPIQFSTIHSSKGLEWDIVMVIDMSDYIFNLRGAEDCEAFYAEKVNLTYVAITRAVEELYIFANANGGGRHRNLARMGDNLDEVFDVTLWGEESRDYEGGQRRPISITKLIKRVPQHPDLFERIRKCSEHIKSIGVDGFCMPQVEFYDNMKQMNRELAFGTYVDWKLKKMLCGDCTFQDAMLELMSCYPSGRYFYKADACDEISIRKAKLDVYFMNADKTPRLPLEYYVQASRYMGLHTARVYGAVDMFKQIYDDVERTILKIAKKGAKTIRDEYILAQAKNFYMAGSYSEIQAFDAPVNSYMGMPEGVDEFIMANIERAADTLRACLHDTGAGGQIYGDVCLESESLIMGEADIVSENGVLLEIKCGTATKSIEMRDVGNCKHLLQVLSYVALARHGTNPIELKRACIVNPLTGAWERYDLSTWSFEQSSEFMACLEEIRARG